MGRKDCHFSWENDSHPVAWDLVSYRINRDTRTVEWVESEQSIALLYGRMPPQ